MFPKVLIAVGALALVIGIASSQSQPFKIPIVSSILPGNIPLGGLFSPSTLMDVVEGLRAVGNNVAHSNFLMTIIKLLEVFRALLKVLNVRSLSFVDDAARMLHGVLESVNSIFNTLPLRRNSALTPSFGQGSALAPFEAPKQLSALGLLSSGTRMLASIPRTLLG